MNYINTKEIAKLANVSRSTVSRVINNYSNVPPETREKVYAVIEKHGYSPNHFARTLAGADSNIIAIFIADINDSNSDDEWIGMNSPYNMELLSNLISELKGLGYISLVNIITKSSEIKEISNLFKSSMIYGGIFTGFPYKNKELTKIASSYNAVFIDQFLENDDTDNKIKKVNCDDYLGGYLATKHLIENGHRNILHIEGDDRLSSLQRKNGYLTAINECEGMVSSVISGMYKEDTSYEETKKHLKNNTPTAIFAANDIMSLGAIRAINDSGLSVMDDISIVGYDNLKLAKWLNLNLSTFEISLKNLSKSCIELLFDKTAKHIIHTPTFIEKGTVKKI